MKKFVKTNVDNTGDDIFEFTETEYILNLDFYLHRSILKWQDALEAALRQGENIDTGLINRGLAGDMVEGIARAKGLLHWELKDVPDVEDKDYNSVVRNNLEAEEFQDRFKKFCLEVEKMSISSNVKKVKLSDFKVFEVLRVISKSSTKRGTVIV